MSLVLSVIGVAIIINVIISIVVELKLMLLYTMNVNSIVIFKDVI